MVNHIDEQKIARALPKFRQDLALLNKKCEAAGITLEFDADRAVERDDDGANHRVEIVNAINQAKGLPSLDQNESAKKLFRGNVLHMIRFIDTIAGLAMNDSEIKARAANAPVQFDENAVLDSLQSLFVRGGVAFDIDFKKAMGYGVESGKYRVELADAIASLNNDHRDPTRPDEVELSPFYEDKDELLAYAKLAIASMQYN